MKFIALILLCVFGLAACGVESPSGGGSNPDGNSPNPTQQGCSASSSLRCAP